MMVGPYRYYDQLPASVLPGHSTAPITWPRR
jgi:hypothetical protein